MLLVIDIGNSNIVTGCFDKDRLIVEHRLKTDSQRTIDEYAAILLTLFERDFPKDYRFQACAISSVVPPLTSRIVDFVERTFKLTPLVVSPGVKTGIAIKISEPSAVGSDRVVNAVAAKELYGMPALVVDFGTATSFDYVSSEGHYEGGIIAPGVATALDALVRNTAKLPKIEIQWPKSVVGKSTIHAMQSGSVLGYGCLVDGLVDQIVSEVGDIKHVIATGGLGEVFSKHCRRLTNYDPHLTLKGLMLIAKINGLITT